MTMAQAQTPHVNHASTLIRGTDIEALIGVTRRLTDLLVAEIAALRAMRPRDIAPLQEEKTLLTGQYERGLKNLQKTVPSLDAMDSELSAELTQSTAQLQDVISDNRRALEAAREVNERLISTIADEIGRQRNPAGSYGPGGAAPHIKPADRKPGPITLDQNI